MHGMGIDDAYTVEDVLARGRGGVTERVTIDGAGPFVRKKIPTDRANRAVWAQLAGVSCPRLPQVVATYELPDQFVVVYDYVPGSTLEQAVEAGGAFAVEDALTTAAEIAEAVAELHAVGVIHRDLSPANIILAADGAHVIDLGIATMKGAEEAPGSRPQGTWGFAAPEQYGFAKTDERSDIYAIGRLARYLLTGCRLTEEQPTDHEDDLADVPAAACAVVVRAAAFEPSQRYQTAGDLARALRRAASGGEAPGEAPAEVAHPQDAAPLHRASSVSADDACTPEFSWPEERRRPKRVKLIAATVAVVAVVAVAAFALGGGGVIDRFMAQHDASDDAQEPATAMDQDADGAAPNGSTGASVAAETGGAATELPALELVESGYTVDDMGFVNYGVTIHNPSEDVKALFPCISLVGRAQDGTVLFSDQQYLMEIAPGETVTWGGIAGNGQGVPATVEIGLLPVTQDNARAASPDDAPVFEVRGVQESSSQLGGEYVTGEVVLKREGSMKYAGSQIAVTIIMRDAQGAIVYGNVTFIPLLEEGATGAFELLATSVPEHATVEAHALMW